MQLKLPLTFIISILIIAIFGSIVFILTPSPQSFGFFALFVALTSIVVLTLMGKKIHIKIPLNVSSTSLYLFMVITSAILVALQLTNTFNETIDAILYILVFIFALGLSTLTLLNFKPNYSRIELIAIAYPVSLALLALFGTVFLLLPSSLRGQTESMIIMALSILALIKKKKKQQKETPAFHVIFNNNGLILTTILLLFVFIYIELYPQISSLLGLDIARNYAQALSFTKDNLNSFFTATASYPLFSIFQSSTFYIVKPSIETFQIIAITLNILALLTFYAMASQYLKRYGEHAAAVATMIWGTFAGLSWLNFFTEKLADPNSPFLTLIGHANMFSYGDITWRRFFFYLSMETSFVLVFAVLYFLKRNDLSKKKQLLLMTLLIAPIPLMHQYATYLLIFLLLCFGITYYNELKTNLRSTGYSLIIAAIALFPLNWILEIKGLNIATSILTFSEYLAMGLILIIFISTRRFSILLKSAISRLSKIKLLRPITIALFVLFFASLALWLSGDVPFNFVSLNLFGYVPLFLYPVKLGIAGILAIATIYLIAINPRYRSKELYVFIASGLLLIILSIFISTIQMQYVSNFTFDPGNWLSETLRSTILSFREERMFEVFKIPLALIASVALGKFIITKTMQRKPSARSYFFVSGLISIIIVAGMGSTLLGFSYYKATIQTNPLSSSELTLFKTMQKDVYTNGKAIIIAPQTPTSYLAFTGATAIATESTAAWTARSPELPLFVTRYTKTTPTYVYLQNKRDYQKLISYAGNYLPHTSNLTQVYLENNEVQIKEINNSSIPTPESTTALIVPYDTSTMSVAETKYQEEAKQYTVASLFFQEDLQSLNFYKEPINYTNVQINGSASFNGENSYIRLNGTQTNFNKLSIEFAFQPLNITRNQVIACKFDWGTPPQKSWEIVQYGKKIAFKLSPNGQTEEVLTTGDILQLGNEYAVKCQYDGTSMTIFVNNQILTTKPYDKGIFQSDTDLTIGAELNNNKPTGYAKIMLKYIRILNDLPVTATPIFYAYDLLSLAGLNYTTVLSIDQTLNEYNTLLLPYDDITSQDLITEIENHLQSNVRCVAIINTNGYGPLLNIFGNKTSETLTADKTLADQHFMLQPQIKVPKINLNSGVAAIAQYASASSSSPFVMETTQGQLTLIYINIYPLISQGQLFNPTPIQTLAKTLTNHNSLYDGAIITPWFTEPSLLFTKLQATGTVIISSNSVASINLPENQTLKMNTSTSVLISSNEITVQSGYGFYTTLTALNPTITFQDNQTTSETINGNATFLLRQPEISVNGTIRFEDFRMLHPPTIYTDGRNTTLSGDIELDIYVSDEYTIALPYKLNSPITVTYETPLMEFDETQSLIQLIPYMILIAIFAIPILLIQRSEPPTSKRAKTKTQ